MAVDIWVYRETVSEIDLAGFHVEAVDGEIGKVDPATFTVGGDAIIVDTGPLVFGRKVFVPVGIIERVDNEAKRIYIDRTKDEIKHAPEYDPSGYADQEYRIRLGEYYAPFYDS
jgi:hypothetical protein